MTQEDVHGGTERRTVLAVGMAGAAGLALAACGSSGSSSPSSQQTSGGASGSSASGGGTPVDAGSASQVPVGGAAIVPAGSTAFVVAQPTSGNYVAHSAVCPHQGCLCNQVQGKNVVCPCHGSEFDAESGAVVKGPAKTGLAPAQVKVTNGNLSIS